MGIRIFHWYKRVYEKRGDKYSKVYVNLEGSCDLEFLIGTTESMKKGGINTVPDKWTCTR